MRGEVLGVERRRHWTDGEKSRLTDCRSLAAEVTFHIDKVALCITPQEVSICLTSSGLPGIKGAVGGKQFPATEEDPQLKMAKTARVCFKITILSWLSHSVAVSSFQCIKSASSQNAPLDCEIIIMYRSGSP
jgi:hypothetical protein